MCQAILGALAREDNAASLEVDLGPSQTADLLPARPGEDEQLDDAPVVAIGCGAPDAGELLIEQHAIALDGLGWPLRPDDRIFFGDPLWMAQANIADRAARPWFAASGPERDLMLSSSSAISARLILSMALVCTAFQPTIG